MTLWHRLVADLGRACLCLSAARTNIRVCDRRVTAFCGPSAPLQRDDCIAAYFSIKRAAPGNLGQISDRSVETRLEHADERDLIETFVERSRWHCRAARETFSTDEFRAVTTVVASTT